MTGRTRLTLPASVTAPSRARAQVALHCGQDEPEFCQDAQLLTSEIVTNAIEHGVGDITLEIHDKGDELLVSVTDLSTRPLVQRPEDLTAEDGRGLLLVESLSRRWGVEYADDGSGKRVWFQLARKDVSRRTSTNLLDRPPAQSVDAGYEAQIQRQQPDPG